MEGETIVLVTGANQGFGFEIVRALCSSERKYAILVGGRSFVRATDAAKAAVFEFPSTNSRTWPIQVDVEDDDSISGAAHEIESKFGRLDVLINNAGMCPGEYHEEFRLLLSLPGAQYEPQLLADRITMRQMWNLSW